MTGLERNLPQPQLPEHDLIRDAAPMPELSPDFRERLMTECGTNVAQAQRAFRMKIAGAFAAACCLCLLLWPATPRTADHGLVDQPAHDQSERQTDSEESYYQDYSSPQSTPPRSPNGGLAADNVRPIPKTDMEQMDELIEDLQQRSQQIFDANMLPRF